ncbi:MAG: hypothetical protein A3D44_04260 [Candidatus Staskawiczbacteria bacterium RIFCSPHIGHO2_02_FULL_42_22]|uniref:Uncharacterized protein n=1 Tax=Candidatus Staskawiczbacteria bacterium RIFCSPHIGHO2_02_FULL_42_22 TaxID=1802207 RepID=A0A1G2I2H2_9BACT|nr:MAG: hypothetical protein A3D44_04260 [Candidatus Staskawiczbacteria bacterium RIFCSPHIGHO2_02_FULL_42_22]
MPPLPDHIPYVPAQVPAGVFDGIILAIKQAEQHRQSRRVLCFFIVIFGVSLGALPFSLAVLIGAWNRSAIGYFLSAALENGVLFFSFWQDFLLSIAESLPMLALVVFAVNVALLLFTLRLFIHKKGEFFQYLWKTKPIAKNTSMS